MNCPECNGLGAVVTAVSRYGASTKCTTCNGTGQVPEDPFDTEQTQPNIQLVSLVGKVREGLVNEGYATVWLPPTTLRNPLNAVPIDEYDIDGSPHIIYYHRSGFYAQRKDK